MQEAARAGAMATLLFEMLVEKTWTVPIRTWVPVQSDKPEVEGVYVSLGPGDNSKRLGGGWFYPFETEKGEEEFPEVYRHAVLADGNSIWALVIAGAIVRVMFEGRF